MRWPRVWSSRRPRHGLVSDAGGVEQVVAELWELSLEQRGSMLTACRGRCRRSPCEDGDDGDDDAPLLRSDVPSWRHFGGQQGGEGGQA
jgi:hypothetical protein